jgi:hypothetical protein
MGTATGKSQGEKSAAEIRRGYAALGYELLLPDDVLGLRREDLTKVAAGVTEVLDEVYLRKRDLSEGRTRELACDVANGSVLLFVLLDSDRMVVATTAFTRVEQIVPGSRVSSFEAGRVAKRPGTPLRLAAEMIRATFIWAAENLREIDYLVAHARVARADTGRPYNGGILGHLLGYQLIPAHGVYSNYVAQTVAEPFIWTCAPVNRELWREGVQRQAIYLPDDAVSRMFGAMLDENLGVPVVYAGPRHNLPSGTSLEIWELKGPSSAAESLYVLTTQPMPARKALARVPGITLASGILASAGLSDRIIMEDDIVSQASSAYALAALRRQGFDLAGWAPSSHRRGRIALVLTRPGTVPAQTISVAPADLSALHHLPAAGRFLAYVLSRRPLPTIHTSQGFEDRD